MSALDQILDDRDEARKADRERAARDAAEWASRWVNTTAAPEVRILAFEKWCRAELRARIVWPDDPEVAARRIEQARLQIEGMVLTLWRRGWMLDGKRLAARIVTFLDAVGGAQRKGGVRDFWAYFKSSAERYVGANAEEIHAEAMGIGSHVSQHVSRVKTLPEMVAAKSEETLRERLAKQRRKDAAKDAESTQQSLF